MADGGDVRTDTPDPFQNISSSGIEDRDLGLGRVQGPSPMNLSSVGQGSQNIATMLSDASGLIGDYIKNQIPKWQVEGKMAFAQGQAYKDVAATGNAYTVEGYQAMQATAVLEKWEQSKLLALSQGDQTQDPSVYSAGLQKSFNGLFDNIQDPQIKALVAAHAETIMPNIAGQQLRANAEYTKEQTIQANTQGIVSALNTSGMPGHTDQDLQDRLNYVTKSMQPDDANKVIQQVWGAVLATKDTAAQETFLKHIDPTLLEKLVTPDASPLKAPQVQAAVGMIYGPMQTTSPLASDPELSQVHNHITHIESGGSQFNADGTPKVHVNSDGSKDYGIMGINSKAGPGLAALAGVAWDEHRAMYDQAYNEKLGDALIKQLAQRYGTDSDGKDKILAAYNAGPAHVDSAIARDAASSDETSHWMKELHGITGANYIKYTKPYIESAPWNKDLDIEE